MVHFINLPNHFSLIGAEILFPAFSLILFFYTCNVCRLSQVLTGHTGSVLCLQYDENVIISGSSDSTVRVWDVQMGEMVNTLIHHCEAVLHLRFSNGMMVTCSKVHTQIGRVKCFSHGYLLSGCLTIYLSLELCSTG